VAGVGGEQFFDPGSDGAWREQSRRAHRLELALARPVGDAAEMVDVTVAGQHGGHGRQRAVGAARVEGEVELRQQDYGPVAGA
jgi:hypothetical protein